MDPPYCCYWTQLRFLISGPWAACTETYYNSLTVTQTKIKGSMSEVDSVSDPSTLIRLRLKPKQVQLKFSPFAVLASYDQSKSTWVDPTSCAEGPPWLGFFFWLSPCYLTSTRLIPRGHMHDPATHVHRVYLRITWDLCERTECLP